MIKKVADILDKAVQGGRRTISVAAPHEIAILRAVVNAVDRGLGDAILFGDRGLIMDLAATHDLSLGSEIAVVEAEDEHAAIQGAVDASHEGRADVLVKGLIPTSSFLRAVLDRELGLRSGQLLSHVAVFDAPSYDRPMLLTDAGINIKPNVHRKVLIIKNAVTVARALGMETPRVALLAAVDKLNYPAMQATLDAALVSKIAASGSISEAVVEGPFALDNAISPAAVATKGTKGDVAGRADVLVAPEIETANVLYKALQSFCGVTFASIVVGAEEPLAVPSRSDSPESKLMSIALACLLCEGRVE